MIWNLKGQSNEIFDLQFFVIICTKNALSYSNLSIYQLSIYQSPRVSYPGESIKNPPKNDSPGYHAL